MSTIIMVRTVCCESYRCGNRCSICPNAPRNREAVQNYRQSEGATPLGRRFKLAVSSGSAFTHETHAPQNGSSNPAADLPMEL